MFFIVCTASQYIVANLCHHPYL